MFTYTTDQAAFIDRIVVNVWSPDVNAAVIKGKLESYKNSPILGNSKVYSWCISGKERLSGNPIAIVYGRAKRFANVPKAQITFRSESVPVTGAQIMVTMTELLGSRTKIDVSVLELTLDSERVARWRLCQEALYRARTWREISDACGRRKTRYIGSRASDVQLRIYDKTDRVVRLEFVLRSGYLRPHGITHPLDLVRLRAGQVWQLFSLRSCSAARIWAATGSWWRNPHGRELLCEWRKRGLPNQELAAVLREGRADVGRVLVKSGLQQKYEKMLGKLIW